MDITLKTKHGEIRVSGSDYDFSATLLGNGRTKYSSTAANALQQLYIDLRGCKRRSPLETEAIYREACCDLNVAESYSDTYRAWRAEYWPELPALEVA